MKKLEYKHRIAWFISHYYETGMEYPILLENMKNEDLDKVKWYNGVISIPTELEEGVFEHYDRFCNDWENKMKKST